jgi:hypothetical protein
LQDRSQPAKAWAVRPRRGPWPLPSRHRGVVYFHQSNGLGRCRRQLRSRHGPFLVIGSLILVSTRKEEPGRPRRYSRPPRPRARGSPRLDAGWREPSGLTCSLAQTAIGSGLIPRRNRSPSTTGVSSLVWVARPGSSWGRT